MEPTQQDYYGDASKAEPEVEKTLAYTSNEPPKEWFAEWHEKNENFRIIWPSLILVSFFAILALVLSSLALKNSRNTELNQRVINLEGDVRASFQTLTPLLTIQADSPNGKVSVPINQAVNALIQNAALLQQRLDAVSSTKK